MPLILDNILVTGRTYEEYVAFFDLDEKDLRNKKVLDCPSGASSFIHTAKRKNIDVKGVDILYENNLKDIYKQGKISIEKIYEDVSWMKDNCFNFYKTIQNHKHHRVSALEKFYEDFNKKEYIYNELPKLNFEDNSFDLLVSSHLLFVYDDRLNYEFHKNSILEMLRVSKEVRIFPLVDFQNKNQDKEKNFSPFVYRILEDLKNCTCQIKKVDFEFQAKANYMLKISKSK